MTYKPPYEINTSILNKVAAIMKLIGRFSSMNNLKSQPILRKENQIKSIHSSLAIENNKLSESQVSDLINGKLVIGPKKDIIEVQNAIKVYEHIQEIDPYAQKDLLKYHKILMTSLVSDAGSYRKKQVGVFDEEKAIFMAPPADRVPLLMNELYDYLNDYEENILIKSCVFHYEFEFIHPFSDGNGRMGRLFQTCLLAKEEELFYYLPVESIIKQRQQDYYDAISGSNHQGASTIFIEFMLDAIIDTINETMKQSNIGTGSLPIQAKKLLAILEAGIPYTTLELMEKMNIKSRASFKKHYIDPLLHAGMIEMTLPETPKSRNQRYIRK
ncbi:MAG: Fic family protein [Candidatus Izemoplasmatales bacterium]|nr:Fic family protein [Candidatus Izemoplasmatales bacterium]